MLISNKQIYGGRGIVKHNLSTGEGLKDIGNTTSMTLDTSKSIFLERILIAVLYLVHYDTLLQNLTNIVKKFDSYLIVKCNESLLQHGSGISLKNDKYYYKL